jgi:hypothetical protein
MTRHTLELRVDDDKLWWAIQRKKLEYKEKYGCNNWLQVLYKWANMPTLSDDDQIKCDRLYEVMGKMKSPELKKKCQAKAEQIITGTAARGATPPVLVADSHKSASPPVLVTLPARTKAEMLKELVIKRDQLLEMIDDPDLSEARREQCEKMLIAMDRVIKDNGPLT